MKLNRDVGSIANLQCRRPNAQRTFPRNVWICWRDHTQHKNLSTSSVWTILFWISCTPNSFTALTNRLRRATPYRHPHRKEMHLHHLSTSNLSGLKNVFWLNGSNIVTKNKNALGSDSILPQSLKVGNSREFSEMLRPKLGYILYKLRTCAKKKIRQMAPWTTTQADPARFLWLLTLNRWPWPSSRVLFPALFFHPQHTYLWCPTRSWLSSRPQSNPSSSSCISPGQRHLLFCALPCLSCWSWGLPSSFPMLFFPSCLWDALHWNDNLRLRVQWLKYAQNDLIEQETKQTTSKQNWTKSTIMNYEQVIKYINELRLCYWEHITNWRKWKHVFSDSCL